MGALPRRHRPERNIEASQPGELVQIDCFFIGRLSGSKGSVWQHTAIDVASGYTWAQLHASECNPRSRHCQGLLHGLARELARADWKLQPVSTDNGSEFVAGDFKAAVESHGACQRCINAAATGVSSDRAHTGRLTRGRVPSEIVYGARKMGAAR